MDTAHSYMKIWLHVVFSTEERRKLITGSFERKLHQYLAERFTALGSPALVINGIEDHIHVLFLLNPKRLPADVISTVKDKSAYWANLNGLTAEEFSWQTGYGCFSVSESMVVDVENYIKRQKEHHKARNFDDEFTLLLQKYKLA